jgi:hypothetical protein
VCPDCGYVATKKTGDTPPADDENAQPDDQTKKKNSLASAPGADVATHLTAPDSQPTSAKEHTMDDTALKAALEAERKRVADIRARRPRRTRSTRRRSMR